MTGLIGKRNQEYEWKFSNAGSSARRQSTNDILSNLKEKHRRPSEEALFSSGKSLICLKYTIANNTVLIPYKKKYLNASYYTNKNLNYFKCLINFIKVSFNIQYNHKCMIFKY